MFQAVDVEHERLIRCVSSVGAAGGGDEVKGRDGVWEEKKCANTNA